MRQQADGSWVYPHLMAAMVEVGLEEVEIYVTNRQNTVAKFITTTPIMDLCLVAERHPGAWVYQWWWDQEKLDLEGMRGTARAVGMEEEEEDGDEQY